MMRRWQRTLHLSIRHGIQWFRGVGGAAIFIGLFALVPLFFWPGIVCVYAGIITLSLDVWCFEDFGRAENLRWILSALILLSATAVAWLLVFNRAPLEIEAHMWKAPHPLHYQFAGTTWIPEWSDLRINVKNPSDLSYDDLDVVIDTDAWIMRTGQLPSIAKCELSLSAYLEVSMTMPDPSGGSPALFTPPFPTLGFGYRLRCATLPPKSTV